MPGSGPLSSPNRSNTPVEFAGIFGGNGRKLLKGGANQLRDIHQRDGEWQVDVAPAPAAHWLGHKVNFLGRIIKKLVSWVRRGQAQGLDGKLLSAYTNSYVAVHGKSLSRRAIRSVTADCSGPGPQSELTTPIGFQVAAAMNLAGICGLVQDRHGVPTIKHKSTPIDDPMISRMDYLVNLSPQRLAYEFIAKNRHLPTGYLQRVLIPHYLDRLTLEGRLSEQQAEQQLSKLLEDKAIKGDRDVTFEGLMDLRNSVEHLIRQNSRKVGPVRGRSHLPKGAGLEAKRSGGRAKQVTLLQVLSEGMAPRRGIRDYFIQELRHKGHSQEQAREQVVAVLESLGISPGTLLTLGQFQELCQHLSLDHDHSPRQLITAYLGLVSQLRAVTRRPSERSRHALKAAGLNGDAAFEVQTANNQPLVIIERPELSPPSAEVQHTCNSDDLWLINTQVEHSWVLRMTRDMANRMLRKVMRSKSWLTARVAAKLATAAVTGAVSGGVAGALYLVSAMLSTPLLMGLDAGFGAAKGWWYARKVKKYDRAGHPSAADKRRCFYENLSNLVAEKTITDSFNAFFNLKSELSNLSKLEGRAQKTAAEQIKFRRYQALQQLRSAQLGDKFSHLDRLITEAITDISRFDEDFDQHFEQLWRPLSGKEGSLVSENRRFRIFNEAANRVVSRYKRGVVKEDQREWLKILVTSKKDSGRISDRYLREAFGDIKTLGAKELRHHMAASAFNQLLRGGRSAIWHSVRVIGHFVATSLYWNAGKMAKSAATWILKGVTPNKVDLAPVPTAALCVYWVVSFIGGQTLGRINQYLNRVRVKKIVNSRKDSEGERRAFDSDLKPLGKEDWRAMRREAVQGVKRLAELLIQIRKEHDELYQQLLWLQPSAKDELDDTRLIQRAELILRRKYLEHQIQELLSGAVGTYYQETIRGEWHHRQLLADKEHGLEP